MFVVESGGDKVIQNNKQDEPTGEESPTRRKKLSKRQQFRDVNRQLKLQGLAYEAVRKVDGKYKKIKCNPVKQKPYCKQTSCRKNCKLFSQDAIEKTQNNARNFYETKRSRNAFIKNHVTIETPKRRRKKTRNKKTERILSGTI